MEFGPSDKKGAECKLCFGTAEKNKTGTVEPLIHCSKCLTICKNLLNLINLHVHYGIKIMFVYLQY